MRILLVDPQPIFRIGLRRILDRAPEFNVVGEADSWRHLPRDVHQKCDFIIMNGDVDSLLFLQNLERFRAEDGSPLVLVLAKHTHKHEAVQMLQAGANGYCDKTKPPEVILDAIRRVSRRARCISPELSEALPCSGTATNGQMRLSNREYHVLQLIASGLAVKEIAKELAVSVKTISTCRSGLMSKLDLENPAQLVKYAVIREGAPAGFARNSYTAPS